MPKKPVMFKMLFEHSEEKGMVRCRMVAPNGDSRDIAVIRHDIYVVNKNEFKDFCSDAISKVLAKGGIGHVVLDTSSMN